MTRAVIQRSRDQSPGLSMLRGFFIDMVRKKDERVLSMRELAVLLIVYAEPKTVRTVGEIAHKFNISVAVVRHALANLEVYELAARVISPEDNRSILAGQTEKGRAYIKALKTLLDWSASTETS